MTKVYLTRFDLDVRQPKSTSGFTPVSQEQETEATVCADFSKLHKQIRESITFLHHSLFL